MKPRTPWWLDNSRYYFLIHVHKNEYKDGTFCTTKSAWNVQEKIVLKQNKTLYNFLVESWKLWWIKKKNKILSRSAEMDTKDSLTNHLLHGN